MTLSAACVGLMLTAQTLLARGPASSAGEHQVVVHVDAWVVDGLAEADPRLRALDPAATA